MATHTHTTVSPTARRVPARYPSLRRKTESALLLTRNFNAPRGRVFRAFTEPALLKRWWAPKGWTAPYVSVDLRMGGLFHYCMRSPEGQEIWGRGIFRELEAPKRIVYMDSFADEEGNLVEAAHYGMSADHPTESQVTITLVQLNESTRVNLRHQIPRNFSEREMMQAGWNEMLDHLAVLLSETTMEIRKEEHETVFSRLFAVPRERLFDAWLDQELLAEWWGPHGFSNPVCITNPKKRGGFRIVMRGPDGVDQSVSGEFIEIDQPRRLVYTSVIDDAPAEFLEMLNKYRHGGNTAPKLTSTLEFEEMGSKTRLVLRTRFDSNADRDAFIRIGYPEGMAESLERLEELFGVCSMPG